MRYHYSQSEIYTYMYGRVYECNHPIYSICTLYKIGNKGLALIQQYFNPNTKNTWWSDIRADLVDTIYLHPKFKSIFDKYSDRVSEKGLYPTLTIKQIMWELRMKPLKREYWETYFDRKPL